MTHLDLLSLEDAHAAPPGGRVRCAVLATTRKLHYTNTKVGKATAFALREDLSGHAAVTAFSRALEVSANCWRTSCFWC